MVAIDASISIGFFIFALYLISRVAHFINNTKNRLNEIVKKIDDIKE
jgi:predicted membrane channel-forming protein YqfA (hemolysin III family)